MKKIYFAFILTVLALSMSAQAPVVTTIDSIRANNANGIPLDSGTRVQITGIVYGPNSVKYPNEDIFILDNHKAGVRIYAGKNYGYTVTDGDSVMVIGTVSQYGGEEEVDPISSRAGDTILFLGHGTQDAPKPVVVISEANESELIEIQNINMTVATGWTTPATGHYFSVAAGPYTLNIDSQVSSALFYAAKPVGIYNIVGFGYQYKFAAPYTSGYKLTPRSLADFHLVSGINSISNTENSAVVYPNPNSGSFIIQFGDNNLSNADVTIFDLAGKVTYAAKHAVNNNQISIGAYDLNTGIYIVEVRNGDQVFRNKVSVQK